MKLIFSLVILFCLSSEAAPWPDAPWLNRLPNNNAAASAMAFVSPYDLQFFRIVNIWRKLEKKYGDLQVNFIIIAIGEQGLPASDETVRSILRSYNYTSPVLLDLSSSYAKLWRAYVTPTVNLISRDGHITNFDPGNFDPALFEKNLQKILKEGKLPTPQTREFSNDGEVKGCAHSHTFFFGERFGKAWGPDIFTIQSPWVSRPMWYEGNGSKPSTIEINPMKGSIGLLAEASTPARITITIDGMKVPQEIRGRDLQEDKAGNTFISVKAMKMYDVIFHSSRMKDPGQKFILSADSKDLRLKALQTLPSCLEVE